MILFAFQLHSICIATALKSLSWPHSWRFPAIPGQERPDYVALRKLFADVRAEIGPQQVRSSEQLRATQSNSEISRDLTVLVFFFDHLDPFGSMFSGWFLEKTSKSWQISTIARCNLCNLFVSAAQDHGFQFLEGRDLGTLEPLEFIDVRQPDDQVRHGDMVRKVGCFRN